jgi:MoaA/NifB/PqqE/SkfB family radical SAM enzyme
MNNFCVLPFNSISVAPFSGGSLRPCCNAHDADFGINVQNISVDEIINHDKIVSLRNSFLLDKQDSACARCWKIENIGNTSFRNVANENNLYGLKSIIPIKKENTISFKDIQYLDITLGNKCNLACRMCNPYSSSLLAKQLSDLKLYSGNTMLDFSRETKDKLLDLISKSINLNSIYMLGGEPLINEFHDEIVELLIKKDRAKHISIHYSTNLQIDIERYLEIWSKFKFVDLSVSIDGSHQTYEYIRWPGKWEKVFKNLKRVFEFKNEANFSPTIATTVQNLNSSNMFDLISELSEFNASFFFIPVTGENLLEITPTHILQKEIKKLETLKDSQGRIKELIHQYKEAEKTHDFITEQQVKNFFLSQRQFDQYRNQNLFSTYPYFIEVAEKFNVEKW